MAACKIYTPRLAFVNEQNVYRGTCILWDEGGVARFDEWNYIILFAIKERNVYLTWQAQQ